MNGINSYAFYNIGAKLARVSASKSALPAAEMFVPFMEAQTALDALIKGEPLALEGSKADATVLLNKLGNIFNKYFIDHATKQFRFPGRDEVIDAHEITHLRSLTERFETALAAELNGKPVYAVPPRGLFNTTRLIEQADSQFSESLLNSMGDVMRADIRAAGRALAFGLSGACCFYLVRALEQALQRYAALFVNNAKFNSIWKDGLGHLSTLTKDKNGPEPRIITLLTEVDMHYRRAFMNGGAGGPSLEDAGVFFGLTSSLLTIMMEAVNKRSAYKNAEAVLKETILHEMPDNTAALPKTA